LIKIDECLYDNEVLSVYPSPAKENEVVYVSVLSNKEQQVRMKVYDVVGKLLFDKDIHLLRSINTIILNTENWSQGTYMLSIEFMNKVENRKIVIIN
jgi:hypothetical protein